jgi:hypothetical protein
MVISAESIREYLPYYLTEDAKVGIINELKKFHVGEMQYYLFDRYAQEMLQGDGWTRLHLRRFDTGEKIFINGLVLSNTCDVDPSNKRDLPVNIIFAPLVAVDAYIQRLTTAGLTSGSIDAKVAAMRRQEVTNVFYVPAGGGLATEHFVLLDDIHTMPAFVYEHEKGRGKIFTLSQAGFYLFVLKLSMHFCRFHENLIRG